MPEKKSGGLLIFDFTSLRKKIINAPKDSLNAFLSMLPSEVSRRCSDISSEVKKLLERINVYPNSIFAFAKFTQNVKAASDVL